MPGKKRPGKRTPFQGQATQILIIIADNAGIKTSAIVDIMGIARTSVCVHLAGLRKQNFISSSHDDADKRYVYNSLTSVGRQYLDEMADKSRLEPVKDLTSPAERSAQLKLRREEKRENLDDLLESAEDLSFDKSRDVDFFNQDKNETMSF